MAGDSREWHRLYMAMTACGHDGFHAIGTKYDRRNGVLVYFWACERCNARLGEARRERYRPEYDPAGNERFATPRAA
jgi:hypothetical protein